MAIGDLVLVQVAPGLRRPLLVTGTGMVAVGPPPLDIRAGRPTEFRINGTLFCEPEDQTLLLFRGAYDKEGDPARFHGRPDRLTLQLYAEALRAGTELGEWITRPTQLPGRS